MTSIFSGLPNDLIIKIVQIENDRRKREEKKKFGEVIQELNKLSSLGEIWLSDSEKKNMFNARVSMYVVMLPWLRKRGC